MPGSKGTIPATGGGAPLLIVGSALFVQALDATALAPALPRLSQALGVPTISLSSLLTVYLVSCAAFLPVSGWAADRFGARRIFLFAMALMATGNLAAGFCTALEPLLLLRAVQGIAGAMIAPVARILLFQTVERDRVVQAMGWLTIPAMLGQALGPVVGGSIVALADWPWLFWANVPLCLAGYMLIAAKTPAIPPSHPDARLDAIGFLIAAAALALVIFALERLAQAAGLWPIAALVVGALLATAYGRWERRAAHPLLDLSLFRLPVFRAALIGGFAMRLIVGATPLLLVLLCASLGQSSALTGLMLMTSAAGAVISKPLVKGAVERLGYRDLLIGNGLATAILFGMLALFGPAAPVWLLAAALLLGGLFRSIELVAYTTLAIVSVPAHRSSRANTIASVLQQLSHSVGVVIAAGATHWGGVRVGILSIAMLAALGVIAFAALPRSAPRA